MTEKIEIEYDEELNDATEFSVVEYKHRNRTFEFLQITVFYDLPIPMYADFEAALAEDSGKNSARMRFAYDSESREIGGHYDVKKLKKQSLVRKTLTDEDEMHSAIMNNAEPFRSSKGDLVDGVWSAPIQVVYATTANDEGYATSCLQKMIISAPEEDQE
jgi:hypothetical protein